MYMYHLGTIINNVLLREGALKFPAILYPFQWRRGEELLTKITQKICILFKHIAIIMTPLSGSPDSNDLLQVSRFVF